MPSAMHAHSAILIYVVSSGDAQLCEQHGLMPSSVQWSGDTQ